jgi:hypothetical protein
VSGGASPERAPLDPQAVLERVMRMEISSWSYLSDARFLT